MALNKAKAAPAAKAPTPAPKAAPKAAAKAPAKAPAKKAAPKAAPVEALVNKNEIVDAMVAVGQGVKKNVAELMFDAALGAISTGLQAGRGVRLHDIGSFKTRQAGPRAARNPRTGEEIQVPARREVRFSASKKLKEVVATAA